MSYTVPSNNTLVITGLVLGGEADGEFVIYINLTPVMRVRNNPAQRTVYLNLSDNFQAQADDIVDIKVTNCNHRQNSAKYEATLIGGVA